MKNIVNEYWLKTPELFSEKYSSSFMSLISPTNLFLYRRRKKVHEYSRRLKLKNILDVGCGSGIFMLDFLYKGAKVVGIDYSQKMLESAKLLLERHRIHKSKYQLIKSNAKKLPINDQDFDLVLATGLLDYMSKIEGEKFLTEANRVCKKNAYIICGFPAKESRLSFLRSGIGLWIRQNLMKLPPILSSYSAEEIKKLLSKNSFKLLKIEKIMGAMWLVLAIRK